MSYNGSLLTAYVGTYTSGESKGVYKLSMDGESGRIEDVRLAAEIGNPTYLCISCDNRYLYTVAKVGEEGGTAAYAINSSTGELKIINYQVSAENPPCHVSLDNSGSYLFSANYHMGSIKVYPINKEEGLEDFSIKITHEGSGPNISRQEKAHPHFAALTPDEKYLCVVDLGIDKLLVYDFNRSSIAVRSTLSVKQGSGPRHMVFHPKGRFAFMITELSSEVLSLEYNPLKGIFKEIQYISALPEDFIGENLGSTIQLHPSGKFLYVSNRGHDSIAVFSLNASTGVLKLVSHISSGGSGPRDFCLSTDGSFLYVANQNSNNIVVFSVDSFTGKLTPTGDVSYVPTPVCIKFLNF